MPSDTEIVARMVELAIMRHGVAESDLESTLDDAEEIMAAIRRLTPTDTDTAIPAGHDLSTAEGRWRYYRSPDSVPTAASPKPDTDSPVDPGVEGVEIANAAVQANLNANGEPMWDSAQGYASALKAVELTRAALAAKPIAGMDAGEVEDA